MVPLWKNTAYEKVIRNHSVSPMFLSSNKYRESNEVAGQFQGGLEACKLLHLQFFSLFLLLLCIVKRVMFICMIYLFKYKDTVKDAESLRRFMDSEKSNKMNG